VRAQPVPLEGVNRRRGRGSQADGPRVARGLSVADRLGHVHTGLREPPRVWYEVTVPASSDGSNHPGVGEKWRPQVIWPSGGAAPQIPTVESIKKSHVAKRPRMCLMRGLRVLPGVGA